MRTFEREKKTTRDAFGSAVHELAKEDASIIGIGADTTNNLGMKAMSEEFPDRVINIGIAEQNMMGVADGLAVFHRIPGLRRIIRPFCIHAGLRAVPYLYCLPAPECEGCGRHGRTVSRK